jgi:hypothetical protein
MSDDKPTPATPLLGSRWKHRMPPHELASIIAIDAQGIHLSAWLPVAEVQIAGGGTLQTGGRLYHLLASSVEMLEMEWERATDDGREAALCPYCRTPLVWGDSARRGELANVVCPSEACPSRQINATIAHSRAEYETEQRPIRATHVAMNRDGTFAIGGVVGDPGVGFKGEVPGVRIVDVAPVPSSTGGAAEHPVPWRVLHVAERTTEMDAVRWAGLRLWSITAETGKAETAAGIEATIESAPEMASLLSELVGPDRCSCSPPCAYERARDLLARLDAAKAKGG